MPMVVLCILPNLGQPSSAPSSTTLFHDRALRQQHSNLSSTWPVKRTDTPKRLSDGRANRVGPRLQQMFEAPNGSGV
ncbi:hypothetical protein BDW66DRAFT_136449 [Aspergillus desertorum]